MYSVSELGFWLGLQRNPGDRVAAPSYPSWPWIWMELVSDLLTKSAGITPARTSCQWGNLRDVLVGFQIGNGGFCWSSEQYRIPWAGSVWKWDSAWRININSRLQEPWIQQIQSQEAEFIVRLHCLCRRFARGRFMASAGGGGEKGIITGMITRPKLPEGAMILQTNQTLALSAAVSKEDQQDKAAQEKMADLHLGADPQNSTKQGPMAFTEGEIHDEEEDIVEVYIDEEEIKNTDKWTVLARFYSIRTPNQVALFEDMSRAWRLRSDMNYKSLRDNLFIIAFSNEGDFKFVTQGGPWLHRGDALLVAEFNGLTSPSNIPLEVVPIWIRIYDLPLVLMTKARGELYGSKFGRVREVDVEADGRNRHDFFRIRVDLPVTKPLKSKIAIKINVHGSEEIKRFDVRYERIPYFCFFCGFIGHSDKDCDKKGVNTAAPFRFSAELRCSPLKPFDRKVSRVKATNQSGASRRLVFRGAGSAGSSSSRKAQEEQWDEAIPQRADDHDGFETREKAGDVTIDEQLAHQTDKLNVSERAVQEGTGKGKALSSVEEKGKVGMVMAFQGEMIPAMKDLHLPASFGEESTEETSSAHKRRIPEQSGHKKVGRVQQALIEFGKNSDAGYKEQGDPLPKGRASKRSKKAGLDDAVLGDSEATSPGAAGQLAGPMMGSRQEK